MVSLTRLALAHSDVVIFPAGRVGDATAASGVNVGESCKGVCVARASGARGVSVLVVCPAFCAATVCATAVAMNGSCGVFAPQLVMRKDVIKRVVRIYFFVLYIFFLSFAESIILLKRSARSDRALNVKKVLSNFRVMCRAAW